MSTGGICEPLVRVMDGWSSESKLLSCDSFYQSTVTNNVPFINCPFIRLVVLLMSALYSSLRQYSSSGFVLDKHCRTLFMKHCKNAENSTVMTQSITTAVFISICGNKRLLPFKSEGSFVKPVLSRPCGTYTWFCFTKVATSGRGRLGFLHGQTLFQENHFKTTIYSQLRME